jgi:hypothetical protein
LAAAVPVLAQDSRDKGAVLEGAVINKRTQRFLERALVRVLNTELSVLTDTNGQFRIAGLTAGSYDVTASYTGLGDTTMTVKVTDGAVTRVAFELTALDVYVSSKQFEMEVTSPLEGVAHAINEQRRGETLRTVVSVDTFIDQTTGNLEMSYILTPKVQLLAVGRNLFGERPTFSELGIIRNKQQDTGAAWMFAVRFDLGASK